MRGLIKKILKEETEVKEMGLDINKLRGSQPSNYLIKSLKDKEKKEGLTLELKKITKRCNKLFAEIDDDIRNLKWQDIELIEVNQFFWLVLPDIINEKIKELVLSYNELKENRYLNFLLPKNKIENLVDDYVTEKLDNVALYIDEPRNRTHFPDGLPKSLLGYNLGYKIYRKLLDIIEFMMSEDNASKEVQEIYRKLLKSPDINAVVYSNSVLLIKDGLPKQKVIDIVTESIYERYLKNPKSRKLVLNRSIIVNDKLVRIIGESRLLKMMYDLYYEAKKEVRLPFEKLGYIVGS